MEGHTGEVHRKRGRVSTQYEPGDRGHKENAVKTPIVVVIGLEHGDLFLGCKEVVLL